MKLVFADRGWEDLCYWIDQDRKIAKRLIRLMDGMDRIGIRENLVLRTQNIPSIPSILVQLLPFIPDFSRV